jgi:hypothetical protein
MSIPLLILIWLLADALIVLALLIAVILREHDDNAALHRDSPHNHHDRRGLQ